MVKVVTADRPRKSAKGANSTKAPAVVRKRVRQPDGTRSTVYTLDANSPRFEDDFLKVFKLNVARARRNRRTAAAIAAE
jgi:hypothetical protein